MIVEREADETDAPTILFEEPVAFPDPDARDRFESLVGVDDVKERVVKLLRILLSPDSVSQWVAEHHPRAAAILKQLLKRPPLIVLAGDVGSGKSELAETAGDVAARLDKIPVTLLSLSLATRGQGRVGEMTQLLATAFQETLGQARKLRDRAGKTRGGIVLLIDEADALAQSREASQMHHEDRAGVNALIRGVDRIANARVPVAIVMCTNRLDALDPAVRRRAADVIVFGRPTDLQRRAVLTRALEPLGFTSRDFDDLVEATGARSSTGLCFTFSDLSQRLIPAILLDAFPDQAVRPDRAVEIAKALVPTPPFRSSND